MSETRSYSVFGVHCDHCRAAIEGEVAPLEGVAEDPAAAEAKTRELLQAVERFAKSR